MSRSRFSLSLVVIAVLTSSLPAQRSGSGGSSGSTGTTSKPTGTTSTPRNTNNDRNERQMVFVTGRVVTHDGNPPPEPAVIERVCAGRARREGYTDAKGQFSLQLGQNLQLQDVTEDFSNPLDGRGMSLGQNQGVSQRELMGCEIRAVLAGYQSSTAILRMEGSFGQIDVGTIVVSPTRAIATGPISVTSMQAPDDAKKALEKAQKAMAKEKLEDAEKELTRAVQIYPRYAQAWWMLGNLHGSQDLADRAAEDFTHALSADPQFVSAHYGMAIVAMRQKNWAEVVRHADQASALNAAAFPDAYFFSAVANYNSGKIPAAETSARKFLAVDSLHRRPEAMLLMSEILKVRRDFAGAAEQKRAYLAAVPNDANAAGIRAEIKQLEEINTAAKK